MNSRNFETVQGFPGSRVSRLEGSKLKVKLGYPKGVGIAMKVVVGRVVFSVAKSRIFVEKNG